MDKTKNPLQRAGWIAKYSMEVRGILLQGTAFYHVNRLIEEGAVDNISSPKKKINLAYFKLFYCCNNNSPNTVFELLN